jgi:acetylornithine deacetylase/succinyl-diaminopimelate desuccinylase-like protein
VRSDLLDVLQVLDSTPAPRGRELAAALVLRDRCAEKWPAIDWQVQRIGAHAANLIASHGPGPVLYSHLDTSRDDGPHGLAVDASTVCGFGLAVARGPAAAAVVAFAAAGAGSLLLASAGTHRRGGRADGVHVWLEANPSPPAAIVAKCGPPGVLWSEPGAAYLTVTVTGEPGVVMLPDSAVPAHGLPARLAPVLDTIAAWCIEYAAAQRPIDQVGAAAGIGAVQAGLADKPDLFPGSVEIGLYLVTVPGADVATLAGQLADRVSAVLPPGCSATVGADVVHAAACTDAGSWPVQAAQAAWTRAFGAPAPITGWTGSTDGVVFRGRGVPTVRLGPQPAVAPHDARCDVLQLDQLEGFVSVYRELLEVRL